MYLSRQAKGSGSSRDSVLQSRNQRANEFNLTNLKDLTEGSLSLRTKSGEELALPVRAIKQVPLEGKEIHVDFYDLRDEDASILKNQDFADFDSYMMLKHAGAKSVKSYRLVNQASSRFSEAVAKLVKKKQHATHLYNLMLTVVPAVYQGASGDVVISIHDERFEEGASEIMKVRQKVDQARVYLLSTVGYSVPISEFKFAIKVATSGLELRTGNTAVWMKAAWNMDVSRKPIFIPKSLGISIDMQSGEVPFEKLALQSAIEEASGMSRSSFSANKVEGPSGDERIRKIIESDKIPEESGVNSDSSPSSTISVQGPSLPTQRTSV